MTWILWRQDDNGNRVEMARFDSRDQAEATRDRFEARGHKQMYWVTEAGASDRDVDGGG